MRSRKRLESLRAPSAFDFVQALERRFYLSASTTPAVLATGSVDLTGAIVVTSKSTTVKQGHPVSFAVTVTNDGSAAVAGPLEIELELSSRADGAGATEMGGLHSAIHLQPGRSVALHFLRDIPPGTLAGTYYYVIDVDPRNSFNEANSANNVAVSTNSITVVPLYPALASIYTGTVNVMSGPDRGNFGDITTYITDESANGILNGDGTVDFNDGVTDEFNFEGAVSQNGRITERLLVSTGGSVSLLTTALNGDTISGTYRTQRDVVRFSEGAFG